MSSHRSDASTTNDNTGNSSLQSPSPNRRSPVWEYYEPELIDEDGVLKAVCKYCGSKMTTRRKTGPQVDVSNNMVSRSPVLMQGKRKIHRKFDQFRSQRRGSWVEKSELYAYLEEEPVREDENFEILSWWKTNSNKYAVLSNMARDVLAIPLSTVSSESVYNLGGRILSDNRSSMTPQTLEALVCCRDWLYKYPTNEVQEQVMRS